MYSLLEWHDTEKEKPGDHHCKLLWLSCRLIVTGYWENGWQRSDTIADTILFWSELPSLQPLRPLSSMTDEEVRECDSRFGFDPRYHEDPIEKCHATFTVWLWLIRHGFDVEGKLK